MTKVSAQYLEGIKEGRRMTTWAKLDSFYSREWLEDNIISLKLLRLKMAPLANTKREIEFFDGQIDFYVNQQTESK